MPHEKKENSRSENYDVTPVSSVTNTEFERGQMKTNILILDGFRKIIDRPLHGNLEGKSYRKRFLKKGVTR
jgi:hypothetical protein